MPGINKCIFVGALTEDPATRYSAGGDFLLVDFGLVVTEEYTDRQGQLKTSKTTIKCEAWGQMGQHLANGAKAGNRLCVEGKWKNSSYKGKDGSTKWKTVINVRDWSNLDQAPQQHYQAPPGDNPYAQAKAGEFDDDIPF